MMMNPQHHFPASLQRRVHQQIQSAPHRAFRRIFHRRNRIIRLPRLHQAHAVIHRGARHGNRCMTKMLNRRHLRKRAHRAQISNRQRTFHRQTLAHHLAEQARHPLIWQRPLVQILNPPQHLRLALGTIHRPRAFQRANRPRMRCPLVEQSQNLPVNRINRIAVRQQFIIHRHRSSPKQKRTFYRNRAVYSEFNWNERKAAKHCNRANLIHGMQDNFQAAFAWAALQFPAWASIGKPARPNIAAA